MAKGSHSKLGKWNKTEHERFMKALQKYGKNWALIQKAVSTRSLAQVRSHAQKLFLSMNPNDLKTLEFELAQRFESFCSLEKEKNSKTGKKASNELHTIEIIANECADPLKEKVQNQEEYKENLNMESEEMKERIVCQESTEKDINSEASAGEVEQVAQLNPYNSQYVLNMGYYQEPEVVFFVLPESAMVWVPY